MTSHPLPTVHFFDPAFKADPFPAYAALREDAPIHPVSLPDGGTVWLVTRYADVLAVLRDARFAKDMFAALTPEQLARQPRAGAGFRLLHRHLLSLDPPDHTRLRALVQTAFTPRYVETLRPRVQAIADDLLAAIPQGGEVDLIGAYAFPLPLTVIAEMLGVPAEDRDKFRGWSQAVVSNPVPGPGASGEVMRVLAEFGDYLRAHLARLREHPDDSLTSALLHAHEGGDRLDEDELLSMLWLLLVAGFETTVNLIGNGVLALLEHPAQLVRLRADPARLPGAVEELLRFCGPVETSMVRWAREDVTLHGVPIPQGSAVVVGLAAANRDPSHFGHPDDLDLSREVRGHVAFGHGVHYCLGAPLARMEGQIALGSLLRRFPHLRLAAPSGDLRWKPGLLMRGLHELPVLT